MTWAEVVELAANAMRKELPTVSGPRARIAAGHIVEELKIELLKRHWKGPVGDNDMAFFGSFEKAKR
jgi:hypothetical protein